MCLLTESRVIVKCRVHALVVGAGVSGPNARMRGCRGSKLAGRSILAANQPASVFADRQQMLFKLAYMVGQPVPDYHPIILAVPREGQTLLDDPSDPNQCNVLAVRHPFDVL